MATGSVGRGPGTGSIGRALLTRKPLPDLAFEVIAPVIRRSQQGWQQAEGMEGLGVHGAHFVGSGAKNKNRAAT